MTRISAVLGVCVLLFASAAISETRLSENTKIRNWVVYYGHSITGDVLKRFDLVVLNSDNHPPLEKRNNNLPLYLGYLSIGEAESNKAYFASVKDTDFLIDKNENWGSFFVDIRADKWRKIVLDQLIPDLINKGFDGVFLDTLDSALALELYRDKEKYSGVTDSLIALIKEMRSKYPDFLICLNRGMEVWPELALDVDFVLLEDFSTVYDWEKKEYLKLKDEDIRINQAHVSGVKASNPDITVLALDYVEPSDLEGAELAIGLASRSGLLPYVSDLALDEVYLFTLKDEK